MRIQIDTNADSVADLKTARDFLNALIAQKTSGSDGTHENQPSNDFGSGAVFNMFQDSSDQSSQSPKNSDGDKPDGDADSFIQTY